MSTMRRQHGVAWEHDRVERTVNVVLYTRLLASADKLPERRLTKYCRLTGGLLLASSAWSEMHVTYYTVGKYLCRHVSWVFAVNSTSNVPSCEDVQQRSLAACTVAAACCVSSAQSYHHTSERHAAANLRAGRRTAAPACAEQTLNHRTRASWRLTGGSAAIGRGVEEGVRAQPRESWDVRGWSGVGRQASGVGREWEGKRSSGRQVIRMREVGGVPELSRTSATIKGSRSKAR
jgi:hypothetical protein